MSRAHKRPGKLAASPAGFGLEEPRYAAWLAHLFDRPETPNGWYFDDLDDKGFEADARETVALVGCTMARSGTDLAAFSDRQTYCGLNYMTSEVFGPGYCFGDAGVPVAARVAAIAGFCLAVRCAPALGHQGEAADSPLNTFVYMLWDTSPIFALNRHLPEVVAATVAVLETALASSNDACIEGALHGLGHQAFRLPEIVQPVITRFLAASYDADEKPRAGDAWRPLRRELRAYAARAMTGRVL